MLCGHGSRNKLAVGEFAHLKDRLKQHAGDVPVEYGYLEFADPVIHHGLNQLKEQGIKKVLAVPGMLFAAGHVKNDLPSEINNFAAEHKDLDVRFGRELAIDRRLLEVCKQRIIEAEAACEGEVDRKDTLLMVVGRGTNDSDANSNVHKVMRMLWEGMGFGWGEVCYSGVAFPRVPEGMEHAAKMGYKRIIAIPYFLFTGILVRRIYDQTDEVAVNHPDIEFVKAGYLKDHPLVIDTFVDRVEEMLSGDNNMNCQLCKYREQIIGYESDVGVPQVGHHHHVQGIGTDDDHHHGHHHGHDHHHGHSHDVNRHDADIRADSLVFDKPISPDALMMFLDLLRSAHGPNLLRMKGIIKLADDASRPLVLHAVQSLMSEPVRLQAWPEGARQETRLVVITRHMPEGFVAELFSAFADEPGIGRPDRAALTDNPLAIPGMSSPR